VMFTLIIIWWAQLDFCKEILVILIYGP